MNGHTGLTICAMALLMTIGTVTTTRADKEIQMPPPTAKLKTHRLGGVDVPSAGVLKAMHKGQYILHARAGKLSKVRVEKVLLPHDRDTSPQAIHLAKAPDGTVYAGLAAIMCKTTDEGKTWTSYDRERGIGLFEVLKDGTFVGLGTEGTHPHSYVIVKSSSDEGRTWKKIATIPNPPAQGPRNWGGGSWILRLPDNNLLAAISHCSFVWEKQGGGLVHKSGGAPYWIYRSTDGGHKWTVLAKGVHNWASEGGVTITPSGKLFEAHRHQRLLIPGDPPGLVAKVGGKGTTPYKHLFVMESQDSGRTWKNVRQLTTVFGQTRGVPVALKDGTVIVIHDTRYGPGPAGSRAMITRDEGKTWLDEVYYLDRTAFTGSYAGSVALKDGLVLSVVASSQSGNSWGAVANSTDHYAIRWKPVKK